MRPAPIILSSLSIAAALPLPLPLQNFKRAAAALIPDLPLTDSLPNLAALPATNSMPNLPKLPLTDAMPAVASLLNLDLPLVGNAANSPEDDPTQMSGDGAEAGQGGVSTVEIPPGGASSGGASSGGVSSGGVSGGSSSGSGVVMTSEQDQE